MVDSSFPGWRCLSSLPLPSFCQLLLYCRFAAIAGEGFEPPTFGL